MLETPRHKIKRILKVGCGVLLLGVVFAFVDWQEAVRLLLRVNPGLICIAFLLFPLGFVVSTAKWRVLLKVHHIDVPFLQLYRYYHIGFFVSNFLPSNIGGDVARVTFLGREGKLAEVAASTVMERITGFAVLLLLTTIALWARPDYYDRFGILQVLWGGIGCFLVLGATAWHLRSTFSRFANEVGKSPTNRFSWFFSKIGRVIAAIVYFHEHRKVLLLSLVLSALFYAVPILFQYFLFVALGIEIPLIEVAYIAPVVALVSFIPISFNSLGIAEGAFVLFYSQVGILPEQALAAAFLRRLVQLLVSLIGGVFLITTDRRQVGKQ